MTETIYLEQPCVYCDKYTVPQYDIEKYCALFSTRCDNPTCKKSNRIAISWLDDGKHKYRLFRNGKNPGKLHRITITLSDENYIHYAGGRAPGNGTASAYINAALDRDRKSCII